MQLYSLSEMALNVLAWLAIPAIRVAMSRPAMANLTVGYLIANFSMRSGRGSSPPRPTKTLRPLIEAFSQAFATVSTALLKVSDSYCWGIPSLQSAWEHRFAHSMQRSAHPMNRQSIPGTAAMALIISLSPLASLTRHS